jgi:hypothetical protein
MLFNDSVFVIWKDEAARAGNPFCARRLGCGLLAGEFGVVVGFAATHQPSLEEMEKETVASWSGCASVWN